MLNNCFLINEYGFHTDTNTIYYISIYGNMLVCECECVCVSMLTRLRHVEAQRDYARAAQHVDREGQ